MSLSKQEFLDYIQQFRFRELFNDMGWNNDKTIQSIVVDNESYTLQAVGEKSGFKILLCNPLLNGSVPEYNTRKKIEIKVTKLFQEHLIIFIDSGKTEQIWQLVVRQTGKPTKVTETRWHIQQDAELLYQRAAGIFFEMDEEEHITIIDVTKRMAENFQQNNEKVTKKFYTEFKKEHTSFLKFIKGISQQADQEWYASLMLNRLMFCYFIQKKGFLDNNKDYLREKLNACMARKGKVKFYSFYRDFLLVLFHKGLNEPLQTEETQIEIGKIPYLNGGLFDEHELERANTAIDIDDKAFERLFNFFDEYEWHLDTRISATGKDINPDVIGYIFEKYINDRADMGAYYTKEDITDYISKNCILPYLFEETRRNYPKAFESDGELWTMVKDSGDNYVYEAVKKGVDLPLPPEIEQGVKDVGKRTDWNKPATEEYALPTEIWREVADRRSRYFEVKSAINKGEIRQINDFITCNLDIRQFAQDVIENTEDAELLKYFYKALTGVTILDPTCGSGAFLFAAMNILEPLYESCLMRMRGFVEDEDRINAKDKSKFGHKYKYFRDVLKEVQNEYHPNLQYFIYKSIILRNLYGVDIMKEAVEIAKLRLFLKLVATVEVDYRKANLGLEPLPDIDFNIRAGNTLVGFATGKQLEGHILQDTIASTNKGNIEEKCDVVARSFKRYKEIQLSYGADFLEFKNAKEELASRFKTLNDELNHLLHHQATTLDYDEWLHTHQPFHWFAEFYEIIEGNGGFDVVIGNPPYVEYSKVRKQYVISNYKTLASGNLYGFVFERAIQLIDNNSTIGLIVPHSVSATYRANDIQKMILDSHREVFLSYFSRRPGKLFDGADQCLTIAILGKRNIAKYYSTTYLRWYTSERPVIFSKLNYSELDLPTDWKKFKVFPKIGGSIENRILDKIYKDKKLATQLSQTATLFPFYTHRIARYFIKTIDFIPFFRSGNSVQKRSDDYKVYFLSDKDKILTIVPALNSSLFYWFWRIMFDGYHCGKENISVFPLEMDKLNASEKKKIEVLCKRLMTDYTVNSRRKIVNYKKTGIVEYDEFDLKSSKKILDEIDKILAKHFGFTPEELDFIINYDIKFRMGKELEEEII